MGALFANIFQFISPHTPLAHDLRLIHILSLLRGIHCQKSPVWFGPVAMEDSKRLGAMFVPARQLVLQQLISESCTAFIGNHWILFETGFKGMKGRKSNFILVLQQQISDSCTVFDTIVLSMEMTGTVLS